MRSAWLMGAIGLLIVVGGCDTGSMLPEGKLVASKDAVNAVEASCGHIAIDGAFEGKCWQKATALSDFVQGRSSKPPVATRVLVTYDKVNLYVGVICDEPNTDKLVANATGHDGNVWSDDSVEVYVDPANAKPGASEYKGFFVNCKGARYDRGPAESWDPQWSAATKVIEGQAWVAEIALPWKTLGVKPMPEHKLGLMVARNRRAGGKSDTYYLVYCGEEAKDTTTYPVLQLK